MSLTGSRISVAIALAAVLIGAVRIGSTWRLFTETPDEAFHLACGMQWFEGYQNAYETQNPPLAQIVAALGARWKGARFHGLPTAHKEGRAILQAAPDYFAMLASARAGNLVFFLLGCLGVWLLARGCGGAAVAAAAVVSFSLIPVVLGHAGLATTDMAVAALVPLAFWSWQTWLDRPDPKHAALAGAVTALAAVAKFSSLLFLPAMLLALVILRWRRGALASLGARGRTWIALACSAAAFFLVCWAVYRFEVVPVRNPPGRQFLLLDHLIGARGPAHDFTYRLLEVPVPLSEMAKGLGEVVQHSVDGHPAYLLGRVSQHGWWYFFPIALAVKTPLAFLLLVALGAVIAVRSRIPQAVECFAAASVVILVSLPASVNIGVRYVLPVYALAAPLAGLAVVQLWSRAKMTAALGVWLIAASILAHPHYLADFNLLAAGKPERILIDSDLDWGQDLHFATRMLRRSGACEAWVAYAGMFDPGRETSLTYRALPPYTPVHGWVAASVRKIYFEGAKARAAGRPEPYGWLKGLQPVMRAGRSILIYDLRDRPGPATPAPGETSRPGCK